MHHTLRSRPVPLLLVLLAAVPSEARPQEPAPELSGPARHGAYVDAIGQKAAWMGTETGAFEAWVWPWKVFHAWDLSVRTGAVGSEIALSRLARTVRVRPTETEITYVHSRFQIRQRIFAHPTEPVLGMRLEVDTSTDLVIVASFIPDLMPMWPAGMGGQYAFFDETLPGYVISESRRTVNAVIGGPDVTRGSDAPAHQLSGASAFEITVTKERAAQGAVTLVLTGGEEARETTFERFRGWSGRVGEMEEARRQAYDRMPRADVSLPDERLESAYRWAVASLADGYQYAPGLGTGMVAGFGGTGSGFRPGFSWYFGGDTSINELGMVPAGLGWIFKGTFPFLEQFQRDDGKMAHEITRSAPLLDWFGGYPYAYIHGDTTPFWVTAVADYYRWTGDRGLLEASWPALLKAYEFGKWADEDGDGLMDNTRAGLGASELGSLREGLKTGVFIASVWTQALRDLAWMAGQMGEEERARVFQADAERALRRLGELFVDPATKTLNFGVGTSGEAKNDATSWATFPLIYGLLEGEAAENSLDLVASSRISTDWGTRMLAEDSPYYDPVGYNNGAVWLVLTGYAALAEYREGRRYAGYQHLRQVAASTFTGARGRHPEVLSGDYATALETAVPHQLFSSSPIPAVLIRGLLGLTLDVPARTITLRPQLPGGWPGISFTGYPLPGGETVDVELARTVSHGTVQSTVSVRGPTGWRVTFDPVPTVLERAGMGPMDGTIGVAGTLTLAHGSREGVDLDVDGLRWERTGAGPVQDGPREGDPPTGLRIVRVAARGPDQVELTLEGRTGYTYRLPLLSGRTLEIAGDTGSGALLEPQGTGRTILTLVITGDSGTPTGVDAYRRVGIRLNRR